MASKRWTWLMGIAWLFAAMTNAHGHVHYCFDGQEPPASVHLVDSTQHEHEHPGHDSSESGHEDLDVDLPNQALGKACKHDAPAILPVLAWTAGVHAPVGAAPIPWDEAPQISDPPYHRPPSRAPPR
jgi:hypothetical protein